jgi:AraC-like DNA-binding protein
MRADQEELAARIARALPHDGTHQPAPGIHFRRISRPGDRVYGSFSPAFCVIAQGTKDIHLGDETFRYDTAHYLISTVELPLVGETVQASPQRPYLSFRLALDPAVVTSVMVESGHLLARSNAPTKAVDVSPLDPNLLDATLRLVRLTESSRQSSPRSPANSPTASPVTPSPEYQALAPLVIREIVYRLLTGAQAARLAHLATHAGQSHRMARAVRTISDNFDKPIRVPHIARKLGMSASGFHAHFKAVTAMSPLQFQKRLRLQEARRLMLNDNLDAAQAAYQVGYEDPSQFSREYKRHFGDPPQRNIQHLRQSTATLATR